MDIYPLMLYRAGSAFCWDGKNTDSMVVEGPEQHEAALADGWQEAVAYLAPDDEPLLALTAKEIEAALPSLSLEELEALKSDEAAGKSRKGVLADIDAAIDARLKA